MELRQQDPLFCWLLCSPVCHMDSVCGCAGAAVLQGETCHDAVQWLACGVRGVEHVDIEPTLGVV